MSTDNITPIRPDVAAPTAPKHRKRAPRESAKTAAIEKRAEETRHLVFKAQAIVLVSRAAIDSDVPAGEWALRKALEVASGLLETAAGQLEPGAITQTGVFRG
jgi:hypothetical protein